jgi:hypothetical protein
MQARNALLLIGSPKPGRSSSLALGEHLIGDLARRGWSTETIKLRLVMNDPDRLCAAAGAAEVVVLAYPLYVFGLPAPVVLGLERLAEARHQGGDAPRADGDRSVDEGGAPRAGGDAGANETAPEPPRLVAIVNCGFPEHAHNDLSLEMCRLFAAQAGWRWSGGLSLGGGGVIDGNPLRERGPLTRSVRKALDLTAAALDADRDVPAEAVALMAKPMMPRRVYRWVANYGWRHEARANGIAGKLDDRPS